MDTATTLRLVLTHTWKCLSQPVWKNGLFTTLFPDADDLARAASVVPISFCPGLYEAMTAPTPPSPDFFSGVPSRTEDKYSWAVYCIVMQKEGVQDIYIGSGTDSRKGCHPRWRTYDQGLSAPPDLLPKMVRLALKSGWKITHKGMMAYSPTPRAGVVPISRLLFVAMEAMFSFYFWTMHSKSTAKQYGMGECCPWPRESFEYGGLCTHSSLTEAIASDFDLSPEELEKISAMIKEKNRLYQQQYHQMERATRPDYLKARMKKADQKYRKNNKQGAKAKEARYYEKSLASLKWYCEPCDRPCRKESELKRHLTSKGHQKEVDLAASGHVYKHFCRPCHFRCDTYKLLQAHNTGKYHKQRMDALAAQSAEPVDSSTDNEEALSDEDSSEDEQPTMVNVLRPAARPSKDFESRPTYLLGLTLEEEDELPSGHLMNIDLDHAQAVSNPHGVLCPLRSDVPSFQELMSDSLPSDPLEIRPPNWKSTLGVMSLLAVGSLASLVTTLTHSAPRWLPSSYFTSYTSSQRTQLTSTLIGLSLPSPTTSPLFSSPSSRVSV